MPVRRAARSSLAYAVRTWRVAPCLRSSRSTRLRSAPARSWLWRFGRGSRSGARVCAPPARTSAARRTKPCEQLRQFEIHRGVGDIENMAGDVTSLERGSTQLRQALTSDGVGLYGAPGNGPKPVMRMRSKLMVKHNLSSRRAFPSPLRERAIRYRSISAICLPPARRDAAFGDRGLGRLHFVRGSRHRCAGALLMRSSNIDHIHFTCCWRRRAANSPEAFIAVR